MEYKMHPLVHYVAQVGPGLMLPEVKIYCPDCNNRLAVYIIDDINDRAALMCINAACNTMYPYEKGLEHLLRELEKQIPREILDERRDYFTKEWDNDEHIRRLRHLKWLKKGKQRRTLPLRKNVKRVPSASPKRPNR